MSNILFSIITPTHNRADKLTRAVESLLDQTYTDWEMIIVNDSPSDTSYESFASAINDSRIHYFVNEKNYGVNYSRNRALDNVSPDSNWVIFLDDDDYLTPDTLATFRELITSHPNEKWFVTNRALTSGKSTTNFPKNNTRYSYAWNYLITKKCKGDATHCIETKLIQKNKIRFSKHIKQAEEWLFFYQTGLRTKMFYHNHNSTLTDGYNPETGLNFRKRTSGEQLKTLSAITSEGYRLRLLHHPTLLVYLFMRLIRILVKQ